MPPLMRPPIVNAISPHLLLMVALLVALLAPVGHASDVTLLHGTLPNGVRLLVRPETEPEIKKVAISLFVRLDAVAPEEEAIAEMVARTLFYGTPNRTENGILTLAAFAGNDIQVLSTPQYVAITYVTSPSQLTEAVHLLCDCLKSADFRPESLHSALKTQRTERDRTQTDPFEMAKQRLRADLNRNGSDLDSLQRVSQRQAQEFFRTHYVPANTVISVAGRVDPQQTLRLFTAFLLDYTRSAPNRFSSPQEPVPLSAEKETLPNKHNAPPAILPSSTGVAYVLVGTSAPAVTSPDYPAFTVLETLLGGGHASRLFVGTRERLGVGYQVGALYQADRFDPLILSIQWDAQRKPSIPYSVVPATSRTGTNRKEEGQPNTSMPRLLNDLLDDLISHAPTEAELERARNFAIGRDAIRHELLRDRAFFPGWYETLGLHYTFDRELPALLAKVTREDLLRVARIYLDRRATVQVLPPTR